MNVDRILFLTGALLQGVNVSTLGPQQIVQVVATARKVLQEIENQAKEYQQ